MQYKVVPFKANVNRNNNTGTVASQLQSIIDQHLLQDWEYQRMESVGTAVAPTGGCFGIGAQPGFSTAIQVLIFRKA